VRQQIILEDGVVVIPVIDPGLKRTRRQVLLSLVLLIGFGTAPALAGLAPPLFGLLAGLMGLGFLTVGILVFGPARRMGPSALLRASVA
jgi:heme O synthase-like polyprenyltransferase